MRVLASDPVSPGADPDQRLAFVREFRDEMSARPSVVTPFLADLLGVSPGAEPPNQCTDDAIWWRLCSGEPDSSGLVRPGAGALLHAPDDQTAIEVRTERELCALHALSEIACRRCDASLAERCAAAARWHLRELQPDNATNHPWAIQVFIRLACASPETSVGAAASVHAQTQLHSCQVALGRPDRLSACILLHAARSLERTPASAPAS